MARNGSGTYSRVAGTPYVYNTVIDQVVVNSELDDIATALTNSLAKNGETTPTANLPMGAFRHTNVGNAAARTDYPSAGQVQDGKLNWVDGGGTADAITAAYSPAITALVDGQLCCVRATAANATTTPTFAPNGLTARTIVMQGGAALVAGSIGGDGHELVLRYDLANTRWELLNPKPVEKAALAGSASQAFNVGNATVATHAPRVAQIQAQSVTAFTTGGTSTAFTLTTSPAAGAYVTNEEYDVTFHTAAGATPTLARDGLAAKNLKYYDRTGTKRAITATQVPANWTSKVVYDGTDFVVRNVVMPYKLVSFTRDMSLATGTQAVTGVGFNPSFVEIMASVGGAGTFVQSQSFHTGALDYAVFNVTTTTCAADNGGVAAYVSGGNYRGTISSLDADGFTVSWTKNSSPTGTLTCYAKCYS